MTSNPNPPSREQVEDWKKELYIDQKIAEQTGISPENVNMELNPVLIRLIQEAAKQVKGG